ncbi:hypothetical protein L901_02945 [Agrobacterium sp. D14]|nr:hypothetical protein L901_02945 [Agrobacterium sp. D14]
MRVEKLALAIGKMPRLMLYSLVWRASAASEGETPANAIVAATKMLFPLAIISISP